MNRRREGFVLIAVVWLLVIISAVNVTLALDSRARRLQAVNLVEHAQAFHTARAAWNSVIVEMPKRGAKSATAIGESSTAFYPYGRSEAKVVIRPTGCCLNLNEADEEQLVKFFSALGSTPLAAQGVAQSILDWRDLDDSPRHYGAEAAHYIAAGARDLPSNAAFEDIEELQYVNGMNHEMWSKAKDQLRLKGGPRIDLQTATMPVLMTLPGFGVEAAQAVIRIRSTGSHVNVFQVPALISRPAAEQLQAGFPKLPALLANSQNEFEVYCAARSGLSTVVIEGIIRVEGENAVTLWKRVS